MNYDAIESQIKLIDDAIESQSFAMESRIAIESRIAL